MTAARLKPEDTSVLVIDVQERLMPTIGDREALAANCAILLRLAEALDLPALVTEQYARGLGPTVPEVAGAMGAAVPVIAKTRFSALVEAVEERLQASGRRTVLVGGIEAHVCVLQTVLDLRAAGYGVFFCTDAISAGQPRQIDPAFRRMEAAGAVPTGVLSAMYELMADKQHPAFARCLALAKTVRA